MDLEDYIGDYPFEMVKTGFDKQYLPKWKMEKKIVMDLPSKNSNYLTTSHINAENVER